MNAAQLESSPTHALVDLCRASRRGSVEAARQAVEAFRRTAVIGERQLETVPLLEYPTGKAFWLCVYSSTEEMAQALQRESLYFTTTGADILGDLVPRLTHTLGRPVGVVLDVASPDHAMVIPPVTSIVPDAIAVDLHHQPNHAIPAVDLVTSSRTALPVFGMGHDA